MVLPRRLLSLSFAALAAAVASAVMTQPVNAWNAPIVTKGNKFFDAATGLEFRQKGMAYYPRPNAGELYEVNNYDWTTDDHEDVWSSHIGMMKQLGVNTIRLYSVDPSKSHDKFMCACAEAGIYVLVGITAPCENCSILDAQPPACYPSQLFTRAQMVYNAFAVYDNVLGFSVGNENNLQTKYGADGITTAPCVKAFLRDVRRYAMNCAGSLRQVPIGLDIADIPPRGQWLQYYDCAVDKDELTRAEWVGFNPYVECDPVAHKTYAQSTGLQNLMKEYASTGYARPIMFGEFGCVLGANTLGGFENQRSFYDAKWMNEEPEMMNEIVGGNVFEFSTEKNHVAGETLSKTADPGRFGVGFFQPSDCDHANKKCNFIKYPEFDNLQRAYTSTKPSNLSLSQFTPSRSAILECPSAMSTTLPPMPRVTTLECSVRQPVCNNVKSNDHKKDSKKSVPLGSVVAPSNEKRTDDIVVPTNGDGSPHVISGSDAPVAGAHRVVVLVSCLVVVLVQAGLL